LPLWTRCRHAAGLCNQCPTHIAQNDVGGLQGASPLRAGVNLVFPNGFYVTHTKGSAMKVPDHLKIPVLVLALQAALLAGTSLVFLVLIPPGS
jgi:hypothetical protein